MKTIEFREHKLSGARLRIPFTVLGSFGPKHHAMIVGVNEADQHLWVAELSRRFGQRIVPLDKWLEDNEKHVPQLVVSPNEGPLSNIDVAKGAIAEILSHEDSKYNLVFNNCESFVDRHTKGEQKSLKLSPQVVKAFKAAGIVIATGAVMLSQSSRRTR